jgi:TfoX/Sxy family transcriptional regulator of competence genes
MAYDEALAERVRDRIGGVAGVTEKKMFGGIGFMTAGNMTVGVYGDGLIVRVDPAESETLTTHPGVGPFVMGGRSTRGFILVDGNGLDDAGLDGWIERARRFVATLPPK